MFCAMCVVIILIVDSISKCLIGNMDALCSKRFLTEEEMKTEDENMEMKRKIEKRKKRYINGRKKTKARGKITQYKPKAPNRGTTKQNIEK